LFLMSIDLHRGEMVGGGGVPPHCTPSKDFEKLDHKNAIKHKNRGPPHRFSHYPKYPPKRKLKMTVHLCWWDSCCYCWGSFCCWRNCLCTWGRCRSCWGISRCCWSVSARPVSLSHISFASNLCFL
jgi:hypothetical protein